MEHPEPWQVFAENGLPTATAANREEFAADRSLLMGASHVWVWRRSGPVIEILLQKRAKTKKTWPGYYDVSVAGHINFGETPVVAAVREMKEEIGLDAETEQLKYIFSLRTPLDIQEIDHIFLYEAALDFVPVFHDGEVEAAEWCELGDFMKRMQSPGSYNLLDQSKEYFALLAANLNKLV